MFMAGGKRLRPAISFLCYHALSPAVTGVASLRGTQFRSHPPAANDDKLYLIAEISELIHTASLVHDDIIDNALVRRSMPTLNSKWNNAITVVSGDFMFARAAVNLGKLDINEIVCIYARVLENLCAGEIEQIEHKYDTELNWDYYYYSKTYKKTASLIEASAEAVAVLLEVDAQTRAAIKTYGYELGMAFQIVDDILDYSASSEQLGKAAGSDLKDGQVTLPILISIRDSSKQAELIQDIAELAGGKDRLAAILEQVNDTNAINKSRIIAAEYITRAKQALSTISDSKYKQSLLDLADFVISRSH